MQVKKTYIHSIQTFQFYTVKTADKTLISDWTTDLSCILQHP